MLVLKALLTSKKTISSNIFHENLVKSNFNDVLYIKI